MNPTSYSFRLTKSIHYQYDPISYGKLHEVKAEVARKIARPVSAVALKANISTFSDTEELP